MIPVRALDLPTLRAAWWARRTLLDYRARLARDGMKFGPAPAPPPLPDRARRGVLGVLRRTQSTCLERALVLQRWEQAHGNDRDVIIAVRGPSVDFAAHAWLDGEPDGDVTQFAELMRLPPR